MLIPFSGASKHITFKLQNFCLSQLWIRAKMAFGLLTAKWRTLRRNLDAKELECVSSLFGAVAKIHICVSENDGRTATFGEATFCGADFGVKNLPNHNKGHPNALPTSATRGMVEKDQQRASILSEIETMQLQCPIDIILRNHNKELDDNSVVDDSQTANCHFQCF